MSPKPTPASTSSFSQHWRNAYKRFCECLPFVKRKRHLKTISQLAAKTNLITDRLLSLPSHAAAADCVLLKTLEPISAIELCLFVSFADTPVLKPHVIDHIKALAEQNIAVVLIINTDLSAAQLQLPPELVSLLHGVLVRANIGFDFAGWAHAYCLQDLPETLERLYLINDSVVGPLNLDHYVALIGDIRRSPADLIGLTENAEPRAHLQSFFLAVNRRLLHSADFRSLMRGVVNLPAKSDVIECYETQLTRYLREHGYTCHAAFSNSAPHARLIDDTIYNWARLIEQGYPFIKASVLKQVAHTAEAKRLVPARYRDSI